MNWRVEVTIVRLCNFLNETLEVERTDLRGENIATFTINANARVKRLVTAGTESTSNQSELQLMYLLDDLAEYDKISHRDKQYEVRLIQPEFKYFKAICYEI